MAESKAVLQVISAQKKSIGTSDVLRVLPTVRQRTVGPFVFVDHMGPGLTGSAPLALADVPPHPHIGIATVTYLFSGAILHRDSIGTEQLIEPGAVNWMSSGRGIVHAESTPAHLREDPLPTFGVQCWVALPVGREEMEPTFEHVAAKDLPLTEREGVRVRLIGGSGFGLESPVRVASPLVCAALEFEAGGQLMFPSDHEERAVILLDGSAAIDGERYPGGTMLVLRAGAEPTFRALETTRAFLIGGPPLRERRYLDWNFCSTRKERITEAKDLYRKGLLGQIPEAGENLPLPEDVR